MGVSGYRMDAVRSSAMCLPALADLAVDPGGAEALRTDESLGHVPVTSAHDAAGLMSPAFGTVAGVGGVRHQA